MIIIVLEVSDLKLFIFVLVRGLTGAKIGGKF